MLLVLYIVCSGHLAVVVGRRRYRLMSVVCSLWFVVCRVIIVGCCFFVCSCLLLRGVCCKLCLFDVDVWCVVFSVWRSLSDVSCLLFLGSCLCFCCWLLRVGCLLFVGCYFLFLVCLLFALTLC